MSGRTSWQSAAFRVEELDCAEEVRVLRKSLEGKPGIEQLEFDVLQSRMSVTFDPSRTSPRTIVRHVADAGLHAALWSREPAETQSLVAARRRRIGLTAMAGLVTGFGFAWHLVQSGSFEVAFGHGLDQAGATLGLSVPLASRVAYAVAMACGLWFVLPRAWASLLRWRADMNLLMCLAVAGAVVLGEWLEGAMVSFLFALALLLEQLSIGRARRALAGLMDLAPDTARCLRADGDWRVLPVEQVQVGQTIRVLPGERIPLDGTVTLGESTVNQAPITGESKLSEKGVADPVYAGTINQEGLLEVEVQRPAGDSTLARITQMIEQAQSRRAPSEQWVESFARWYTPCVIGLAIAIAVLPPLLGGAPWGKWVYSGLVLLVIACPCALVISTPVSIVSSLAAAARHGVLVKGGRYLEACAGLQSVIFDKTGTLTNGRPEVVQLVPLNGTSPDELLRIAVALESSSTHPIAQSIRHYAAPRKIEAVADDTVSGYRVLPGRGAECLVDGKPFWIGNRRLMRERLPEDKLAGAAGVALEDSGHSVVAIGDAERVLGLIGLADQIRPEAAAAIERLRGLGIRRICLLTGDSRPTAQAVATSLGADDFLAEALPEDKLRYVESEGQQFPSVAMVGDGVNDGPALAAARVGVAMAAIGTDTAIETADVALMADDLAKIPWLIGLARRTRRVILQNVTLALGLKLLFVALALLGIASLWMAIAADTGASLLVIFNGLRLLRARDL